MIEKNQKVYSREEVEKSTLDYFCGDRLATDVWIDKYCLKDSNENLFELNPDNMHRRLAKEFARIEDNYSNSLSEDEIYNLFKDFKYIVPQGRVMAGLGVTDSYRSLSNCLVLPTPNDSYSSIMYTDTMLVNAAKRGCGYGIDLSKLRPKGTKVKNAANTSTGIIPFMERFSNSTREVGQDNRRGACLLGIDIEHPESLNFVKSKIDKTKITGANISLKIKNDFFNAIENNLNYDLKFNNEIYKTVNAKDFWKEIISVVHNSSEPGIFLWDNIINYDPVSAYPNHQITLTNACGEQPMGELDTCRLITINLFNFINKPFTENPIFDEEKFIEIVKKQIRLGDDLVDLEIEYIERILNKIKLDPEPEKEKVIEIELWERVKEKAIRGRRIGCGLTGLGDMIAGLNIKYGSDESLLLVDKIMRLKFKSEIEETISLAKERGSFPDFNINLEYPDNKPYNNFYEFILSDFNDLLIEMKKYGRRNINWNTIAPVGSVSILTKTTSGCEPSFNIFYNRRKKTNNINEFVFKDKNGDLWSEYKVFHHKFVEWFKIKHFNNFNIYNDPISPEEWLNKCSVETIDKYIKESPYYESTTNEINWINRVKMQGILQKYTTSAISSTVNLPENITINEIENISLEAWKNNCKGITIYREGSRDGILFSDKKQIIENIIFNDHHAPKRPKRLKGEISRFQNNLERWIAVVGLLESKPYELFVGKLENGLSTLNQSVRECEIVKNIIENDKGEKIKRYDIEYIDSEGNKQIHIGLNHAFNSEYWNYAKLISGILRHGMPLIKAYELIDSLNFKEDHINTWRNGVARVIKRYIKDGEKSKGKCPECGGEDFEFKESCLMCSSCGFSKCS